MYISPRYVQKERILFKLRSEEKNSSVKVFGKRICWWDAFSGVLLLYLITATKIFNKHSFGSRKMPTI
jgi:hypothetical protein